MRNIGDSQVCCQNSRKVPIFQKIWCIIFTIQQASKIFSEFKNYSFVLLLWILIIFQIKGQPMMNDDTSMPVELFFAGRKLRDLDVFSKSDPFLKLFMQKHYLGNIQYIGRTQTFKNSNNPNWQNKIAVQYFFEMKQPIRIEVFDDDGSNSFEYVGKAQTTLGNIMGSSHQAIILGLQDSNGKSTGHVAIRAEKVQDSSESLFMKWKGKKIANVDSSFDFWDKSDPYLKFMKLRTDNTMIEVARSETKKDNQQPEWAPIQVPLKKLVDFSQPFPQFKVECWDEQEKEHKHQLIGDIYIKINQLKMQKPPIQYPLTNSKIKKPGFLTLQNYRVIQIPTFIDFLKSGLTLNLVAAIDFTGSNGDPDSANSLHNIKNQPNQYQQVLKSIWSVIQQYDTDKKIPAFGFGARPHFSTLKQNSVNHCFPITGDYNNVQVSGFNNLMGAYINCLNQIEFSGPTKFTPLLQQAFKAASQLVNSYSYQILLILTDGQIHDMNQTRNIICQNANLPISIVIVGIGNSEFNNMNTLDGDGGLYNTENVKCPRDIVQFVPYRKFNGNSNALCQQLLKQIPAQICQYMNMIGKTPNLNKPPVNLQQLLANQ